MRTIRCCAAMLLALSACLAQAEEKYTIKPNLKANEAWNMTQTMDMAMNIKINANGQNQAMDQKMTMSMGATMTPLEVKEGVATKSKIKFGDDAKITVVMMGQTQNVPFPLAGKEMTVTKKDDGSVTVDPAGLVDDKTQGTLGNMMESATAFYPTKPVGVGDKWEVPGDKLAKMFQMEAGAKGSVECTLAAIKEVGGKKVADVTLSGKAAGKMQGVLDVTLDLSGPMSIDLESGQVLSQDIKANMTLKGDQPAGNGQVINMDGTGVVNVKQTMTPAK